MYENGFVKVDKGIRTAHPFLSGGRALGAWTYLLILASHAPRRIRMGRETLLLETGTLLTTTEKLAAELQYPERYVRDLLRHLECEGLIRREKCAPHTFLITPLTDASDRQSVVGSQPAVGSQPMVGIQSQPAKSRPAKSGTAGTAKTPQTGGFTPTFDAEEMFRAALSRTGKSRQDGGGQTFGHQ